MAPSGKEHPKNGRPPKELDESLARRAARFGCTDVEIADLLGVSPQTVARRFGKQLREWRAHRKQALRYLQFRSARSGNATMQIWLGKNELGQSDQIKISIEHIARKVAEENGLDAAELIREAEAIALGKSKP